MIQSLIQWVRDNVVTVVCIVLIIASLGVAVLAHFQGKKLRAEMTAREQEIQQINQYRQQQVNIPPANPDDPPTRIAMPVTEPAIDTLKQVYTALDKEYREVHRLIVGRNQANHIVMLEGLFPEWTDAAKRYEAIGRYLKTFEIYYQALNAGGPPTEEEIKTMLAREEAAFRQSLLLRPGVPLTEAQRQHMMREQGVQLEKLIKRNASKHHMYAVEPTLRAADGLKWSGGPFQVGEWARSPAPLIEDIWEGQMQLWIQQDLIQALLIANEVNNKETSLLNQPVKRLLALRVDAGYVGLEATTTGVTVAIPGPTSAASAASAAVAPTSTVAVTPKSVAGGAPQYDPASFIDLKTFNERIGSKLPPNFVASPTGRQSNDLYDVRHAYIDAIVDTKQLPKLLNAIGQVNLMTVIGVAISDVDEYEDLRKDKYWYGDGVDAVRAVIKIETIWLRWWTAGHFSREHAATLVPPQQFNPGLMPDKVRARLGLIPRSLQSSIEQGTAPIAPTEPAEPPPADPATEPAPPPPAPAEAPATP